MSISRLLNCKKDKNIHYAISGIKVSRDNDYLKKMYDYHTQLRQSNGNIKLMQKIVEDIDIERSKLYTGSIKTNSLQNNGDQMDQSIVIRSTPHLYSILQDYGYSDIIDMESMDKMLKGIVKTLSFDLPDIGDESIKRSVKLAYILQLYSDYYDLFNQYPVTTGDLGKYLKGHLIYMKYVVSIRDIDIVINDLNKFIMYITLTKLHIQKFHLTTISLTDIDYTLIESFILLYFYHIFHASIVKPDLINYIDMNNKKNNDYNDISIKVLFDDSYKLLARIYSTTYQVSNCQINSIFELLDFLNLNNYVTGNRINSSIIPYVDVARFYYVSFKLENEYFPNSKYKTRMKSYKSALDKWLRNNQLLFHQNIRTERIEEQYILVKEQMKCLDSA